MKRYTCSACRLPRPLSAYTPSEQHRLTTTRASAVCVLCKSERQIVARSLRLEGDPLLTDIYREVMARDLEHEHELQVMPEVSRSKRDRRIAEYASMVAQANEHGDGRRWRA